MRLYLSVLSQEQLELFGSSIYDVLSVYYYHSFACVADMLLDLAQRQALSSIVRSDEDHNIDGFKIDNCSIREFQSAEGNSWLQGLLHEVFGL